MSNPKIYLTFDLEEFDIPVEFGQQIPFQEQIKISEDGLVRLLPVLLKHQATGTFFTTAAFALERPALIKQLAQKFEIASHTYHHSSFKNEDLLLSRQELVRLSGSDVSGLRMPRMRHVDPELVLQAGYTYDSSINPIKLPGRYDFSHLPATGFMQNNLLRIPASVATSLRIPLFWLAFKNIPISLYRYLCKRSLVKYGYINLYFHPWEFADIGHYKLPRYVKNPCGVKLLSKLDHLLTGLSSMGTFDQLKNYVPGPST